ncbi:putative neutral sphingomyelinase [Saccostrea cucullata]|uniref:putative neutral sphingomyelinase n=1 Tax=Saccostrea cuccullata TaxID=36930 RepID=UPI002ECFD36F
MEDAKFSLQVLTLNCWGVPVPFACKYRKERFQAIAEEIGKGRYDIVILQEVWTESDFKLLQQHILKVMPYSHYFQSGTIGSGVCVFSKLIIEDSFYHLFPLNGYFHKVQHGDWFGGKGLGLCRVTFQGLSFNIYCTHLHAEYDMASDEYIAHRVAQAFDMSQFIKYTSESCDVVIVGGDFNLRPSDLGYKLIMTNGNLHDCWLAKNEENESGHTNERKDNSFSTHNVQRLEPVGRRLDYLLYKVNQGVEVEVSSCKLDFGKIPDKPYNYSDHEGVTALLQIQRKKDSGQSPDTRDENKLYDLLLESTTIVQNGLKKAKSDNLFYTVLCVVCTIALYGFWCTEMERESSHLVVIARAVTFVTLTLLVAFFLFYKLIINKIEYKGLTGAEKDINNLCSSVKRRIKQN